MRILGMDVGDKTIGLAISDPLGITAQGLMTIKRSSIENDIERIKEIIKEYGVESIVIGMPKNMNNTIGPRAKIVIEFAQKLKNKTDINCEFYDERLTTVEAERVLLQSDMSRKKRKKVIDKMAAVLILQSYLDNIKKRC
ncbi:putative holliday junction resolvase [Caldanaerobius fijiensis DSM 17918]|uniref:Putative pre-16S rRNA nuclease n=1 Tax=Caldanaerobius fijiensis DSM 17918 TaxID=1121256 RepID=A0A1M4U1G2_9THEO|nr:Holliday junction resolvase RuvX [Caldanaerobius fijiensis]SHE50559.1 putative holliday junction resolvase [Caldanaerobius fijiensis DSM 17918]